MNLTSNHEDKSTIPVLLPQWVKDLGLPQAVASWGVGGGKAKKCFSNL